MAEREGTVIKGKNLMRRGGRRLLPKKKWRRK
jgi:hypothetical protein